MNDPIGIRRPQGPMRIAFGESAGNSPDAPDDPAQGR